MTKKALEAYPQMGNDIQSILISEKQIKTRIKELGSQISEDYENLNPLIIGVLKGVLFFMSDLLMNITIPVEVDFMSVSRYQAEARYKGVVRMVKDLDILVSGRHVIFVEDVIDTGLTCHYLLRLLRDRQPDSLKVCTMFNKPQNRLIDIPIDYKGFDLPDRFVVGYGLDYRERYRNLPFVGLLKAEVIQRAGKE